MNEREPWLTLAQMTLGARVSHGALALYPLSDAERSTGREFVLLDEGLAAETLAVEELDASGSVPELRVTNAGTAAVLILEGDELIGLKQNRTINATVIVPAGRTIVLPVSCVERGRWSRRSRPSRETSSSPLHLRRLTSRDVHASLRARRGHRSDQGAVWAEVDRKSLHHGYVSETSALHDARLALDADLRAFGDLHRKLPESTRGLIVCLGGRPVALELLPDARTLGRVAVRLVAAYALDALEYDEARGDDRDVDAFLRRIAGARTEEYPVVGEGRDVRLEGDGLAGHALLDGGEVVHAACFSD